MFGLRILFLTDMLIQITISQISSSCCCRIQPFRMRSSANGSSSKHTKYWLSFCNFRRYSRYRLNFHSCIFPNYHFCRYCFGFVPSHPNLSKSSFLSLFVSFLFLLIQIKSCRNLSVCRIFLNALREETLYCCTLFLFNLTEENITRFVKKC